MVLWLIRISRIQWWCSLFSVFYRKYPFWANLVQKFKIVSLRWNLVLKLIRICTVQWWYFTPEMPFSGKFGSKIQKSLFKVKFGTDWFEYLCRCQWWFYLIFCFRPEISFWGKFIPKKYNYQLKLKFGSKTNLNMKNSMAMFTLSVFDRKYPYCVNVVPKFKTILISWNLVQRLVPICWIQWWYSLFLLYIDLKYHFWANLVQKNKIVGLSWNLVQRLIRICKIRWWFSFFFFLF